MNCICTGTDCEFQVIISKMQYLPVETIGAFIAYLRSCICLLYTSWEKLHKLSVCSYFLSYVLDVVSYDQTMVFYTSGLFTRY